MGNGNAGIGKTPNPGADARYDAEGNARRNEGQGFLAAAAEDERIAAFQTEDALAFPRQFDQAQRNIALLGRRLAAAFAGVFLCGARGSQSEDALIEQRVIEEALRL